MLDEIILNEILAEVKRAKKKRPGYFDHPAAQAGDVAQSAGKLIQASMEWKYNRAPVDSKAHEEQKRAMRTEAIKTAAAAIQFLENL